MKYRYIIQIKFPYQPCKFSITILDNLSTFWVILLRLLFVCINLYIRHPYCDKLMVNIESRARTQDRDPQTREFPKKGSFTLLTCVVKAFDAYVFEL